MSLEQFEIIELKRNVNLGHDCFFRNGTSMISLIIPQNGQLSIVNKMLTEEMGTAARIKSRVNRQSVQSAISSVQQRLKLYKAGLCMFCISWHCRLIYLYIASVYVFHWIMYIKLLIKSSLSCLLQFQRMDWWCSVVPSSRRKEKRNWSTWTLRHTVRSIALFITVITDSILRYHIV